MKITFLLWFPFLFLPSVVFAQNGKSLKIVSYLTVSEQTNDDTKVYVTQNKDTIFAPKNAFGFMLKEIWDNDTISTKKPVIVFVDKDKN